MSTDATMSRAVSGLSWVTSLVGRTGVAIRGTLSRWDGRAILVGTGVAYLLVYLWALDLAFVGDGTVGAFLADDPGSLIFRERAPFIFEPIGIVYLGVIDLFVSPVNLAIGLGIAALVGLNLAVAWVAWRGPSACGISSGGGAVAGIPALISGFACCGPTILIIVGIQASAGLIALFQWLLPIAVALLVLTLLWVGSRVEPTAPSPATA